MYLVIYGAVPFIFARDEQLRVDIIANRLPPKVRHCTDIAANVLAIVFMGVFTWYSARLALIMFTNDYRFDLMTAIPKYPEYMLIAVVAGISTFLIFIYLLKLLRRGTLK